MNKKYEELVNKIVDLIGGKDNILFLTHCVTRLRFNVKDKSKVQESEIEKLSGAVGTNWAGDQFQVIIGQSVGDVYRAVCEKYDFETTEMVSTELEKKKFNIMNIFSAISGCFAPLLPAFIGGGMIKVAAILLVQFGLLAETNPTIITLTFVGDAVFYFLPILVGATAAKRFNCNVGLAMLICAMMIHPTFLSMISEGTGGSVFGIPIYPGYYPSTVLPSLLAVYVMSYVEKFVRKISPDIIRGLLEPTLTLFIMVPLTLCILAPSGQFLGNYLGAGLQWLYDTAGFVTVGLVGMLWPFLVLSGMHMALDPITLYFMAAFSYEPLICFPMVVSNLALGTSCAAVTICAKNKQTKSQALSCAMTALASGIIEPGLFGFFVKEKAVMVSVMLGGFIGAAFGGLMHVVAYTFPGSGGALFAAPSFIGENPKNLMFYAISCLLGVVITFVSTCILYKRNLRKVD